MLAISQSSISPVSRVKRRASSFITGKAPGKPRQTGQVCEFGSAPNSTRQVQNIFDRVFSCACTSRPMVVMYLIVLVFFTQSPQRSQRRVWRVFRLQGAADDSFDSVLKMRLAEVDKQPQLEFS